MVRGLCWFATVLSFESSLIFHIVWVHFDSAFVSVPKLSTTANPGALHGLDPLSELVWLMHGVENKPKLTPCPNLIYPRNKIAAPSICP